MANPLDPSVFPSSADFYIAEFENILVGITSCYKMMIEDNISVPSNDENGIRDILLLNYLKNRAIKRKIKLTNYRFDREIMEDTTKGRVDIRIISKNDFEIDEAYYTIECKRLDNNKTSGTSGLNGDYIREGIMRFITEYYSSYYGINGMIGFVVEQVDIPANITNINKLLMENFSDANTETVLTFHNFIKDFKYQYYSTHKDIKDRKIKLYHLMFDFSVNIDKS
ncbi:MAG: hypothetical protein SRB2_01494 [Desulfobacteraceae bacterium Eth-SRB2]|nr:MAG: hypothetical protein SRB2_01494 [Desulfobacteraceae bacterium Eth-SRB2]